MLQRLTLSDPSARINRVPSYEHILKLAKEREGAIFLDVGTCCECCVRFSDPNHKTHVLLPLKSAPTCGR